MSNTVYTGFLTADETNLFILRRDGSRVLEENRIWDGYQPLGRTKCLCSLAPTERL